MKILHKILFYTIVLVLLSQFVIIVATLHTVNQSQYSTVKNLVKSLQTTDVNLETQNPDYLDFRFNSETGEIEGNKHVFKNVYDSKILNKQQKVNSEEVISVRIGDKLLMGACRTLEQSYARCSFLRVDAIDYRYGAFLKMILTIAIICTALTFVGFFFVLKKIMLPLEKLATEISTKKDDYAFNMDAETKDEVGILIEKIKEYAGRLKSYQLEKANIDRQKALVSLSTQVAHDIRSPLMALDVVASSTKELSEEKRILIRNAVSRIKDIANNLIARAHAFESKTKLTNVEEKKPSICLLSSLVEELVTEKRLQFRSKIGVKIETDLNEGSYGLFANIQPVEFKRVISNLINNAVEALGEEGFVNVSLVSDGKNVLLKVEDNGKGIPADILPRLMQKGASFGKVGGLGLGLYYTKETIEGWGGEIKIESKTGQGTTIIIILPKENPPNWFVPRLELQTNQTVVILDDDISIHQVWGGRFESVRAKEKNIKVVHISTPKQLREWYQNEIGMEINRKKHITYLFDFEFLGQKETGLDLIEELNIANQSILVTSRHEEFDILKRCKELGTKLIPKPIAGFVPVSVSFSKTSSTANMSVTTIPPCKNILILNDDKELLIAFKMLFKSPTVQVLGASNVSEALKKYTENKIDVILSDINLGESEPNGYDFLKKVRESDSKTPFYMVSGYSYAEEEPKARASGANGYIQLPFEKDQIDKILQ